MSEGVQTWWVGLGLLAIFNLGAWAYSAAMLLKVGSAGAQGAEVLRWRKAHLWLSAGYVLGCAFRSWLPRADVQRIVLYDSWLSSVAVGRSVATIAELCFVAQWALLLRELSRAPGQGFGLRLSYAIVPMITVAELCSWYAVLTTNYMGNALEQSIWTLTAALMAIALCLLWYRARGALRGFAGAGVVGCAAFVGFMCTVDVPMYIGRWLADEANGRIYLSLMQGFVDASTRWTVTHTWADWHEEIPWMSLYFSLAVWISIGLAHAPRASRAQAYVPSRRDVGTQEAAAMAKASPGRQAQI